MLRTDCIPVRRRDVLPRPARLVAAAMLAVALAFAAGCSSSPQTPSSVVDKKGVYTTAQVEKMADLTPLGAAAAIATVDGPAQRQNALTQLRATGGAEGARVAELLTKVFPYSMKSVPVSIERATVDGNDTLLVIEAAPGKTGKLTTRTLWILGAQDGHVLDSASFR